MDYSGYVGDRVGLYVFDLDGTLVDSLADLALSVNWILAESGYPPIDPDSVRRAVGNGARRLLERSFASSAILAGRKPPSYEALSAALGRYRARYDAHCADHACLYPGIREWLESLSAAGKAMAVLTNKGDGATRRLLEFLGVARHFAVIAGPEAAGVLKPHPEGLHRIRETVGISADRTVMVGDSAIDIQTGKAASVLTCGITGGFGDEAELRAANPDVLIERKGVYHGEI